MVRPGTLLDLPPQAGDPLGERRRLDVPRRVRDHLPRRLGTLEADQGHLRRSVPVVLDGVVVEVLALFVAVAAEERAVELCRHKGGVPQGDVERLPEHVVRGGAHGFGAGHEPPMRDPRNHVRALHDWRCGDTRLTRLLVAHQRTVLLRGHLDVLEPRPGLVGLTLSLADGTWGPDRKLEALLFVAAHRDGRLDSEQGAPRRVGATLAPAVAVGGNEINAVCARHGAGVCESDAR